MISTSRFIGQVFEILEIPTSNREALKKGVDGSAGLSDWLEANKVFEDQELSEKVKSAIKKSEIDFFRAVLGNSDESSKKAKVKKLAESFLNA